MDDEFDRASGNFPALIPAENEFDFGFQGKKEDVLALNTQQLRNTAGINTGGLAAFTVTAMALFLN